MVNTAMDEWPALAEFQQERAGWTPAMAATTADEMETPHGTVFPAHNAPQFVESGDCKIAADSFVFGCTPTGAPAVYSAATGRVWIGSWEAMVELAIRDGIGR